MYINERDVLRDAKNLNSVWSHSNEWDFTGNLKDKERPTWLAKKLQSKKGGQRKVSAREEREDTR